MESYLFLFTALTVYNREVMITWKAVKAHTEYIQLKEFRESNMLRVQCDYFVVQREYNVVQCEYDKFRVMWYAAFVDPTVVCDAILDLRRK